MSFIHKEYWAWDESYNSTIYKLGLDISGLLESKSIVQSNDNKDEYKVLDNENIDFLNVTNNKIKNIYFFRETNFLPKEGLMNLKYEDFKNEIEKILTPVEKDYIGNKIFVVFRDGFVAFVALIGK